MSEKAVPVTPRNLHEIHGLAEVKVRENITLTPLTTEDASGLLKIIESDPSIRESVSVASRLHDENDVANEISNIAEDSGLIRYSIKDSDVIVGVISLWRDDGFFGTEPKLDDYGFGYFLDPKFRKKGIIRDSIKSLMNTVTDNLHVNRFIAYCEDNNQASISVLENAGFVPTDETLREPSNGWLERKYTLEVA